MKVPFLKSNGGGREDSHVISQRESEDALYATSWPTEAARWEKAGIYRRIADNLPLDDGYLHLDFGHGAGHLGRAIKAKNSKGVVVGLEVNSSAARLAGKMNGQAGASTVVYDCSSYELVPGNKVQKVFRPEERELSDLREMMPANPVVVLVDDIRSMAVLRALLGDRQIDSGTLTVPGSSDALIKGEIPINTIVNDVTFARIRSAIRFDMRKRADAMMLERCKRDGIYTLAERLVFDPDTDHAEIVKSYMHMRFGELERFWDVESGDMTLISELGSIDRGDLRWSTNALFEPGTPDEGCINHLAIMKLRRNSRRLERKSSGKKRRRV